MTICCFHFFPWKLQVVPYADDILMFTHHDVNENHNNHTNKCLCVIHIKQSRVKPVEGRPEQHGKQLVATYYIPLPFYSYLSKSGLHQFILFKNKSSKTNMASHGGKTTIWKRDYIEFSNKSGCGPGECRGFWPPTMPQCEDSDIMVFILSESPGTAHPPLTGVLHWLVHNKNISMLFVGCLLHQWTVDCCYPA